MHAASVQVVAYYFQNVVLHPSTPAGATRAAYNNLPCKALHGSCLAYLNDHPSHMILLAHCTCHQKLCATFPPL